MNVGDQIIRAAIWHLTRNATKHVPWWLAIFILVGIALLGGSGQ